MGGDQKVLRATFAIRPPPGLPYFLNTTQDVILVCIFWKGHKFVQTLKETRTKDNKTVKPNNWSFVIWVLPNNDNVQMFFVCQIHCCAGLNITKTTAHKVIRHSSHNDSFVI
jgi:hypothetical protein